VKRTVRTALVLVFVLAVAAGAALWQAGRAGSSAVESWVAGQIQTVADAYLNPKLSFVDLDYEFPSTVRLKSLRLTADDPANPGKTVDILGCEEAELELTEMPSPGQPIQIASIILKKPLFQAVAVGGATPKLVGFSNLIREDVTVTTMPGDGGAPKLSEFLAMKRVELVDGRIVSDARVAGVPRMEIDKINTTLAVERTGRGWYELDAHIAREPILDLKIKGRLNLDTFTAADAEILVKAKVGREHDGYLPPELQTFLRQHEVQGTLEARITGSLPLLDPLRGRVQMDATLEGANLSFGDYRVPVNSLLLSAALEDGVLKMSQLQLAALRGNAQVQGSVTLSSPTLETDLRIVVRDMVLDDTIRDGTKAAQEPKFGGRINAQFAANVPLQSLASATTQPGVMGGEVWGRGKIEVDQGRLVNVPVVGALGRAITKGTSWINGKRGGKGKGTDRAAVVFELRGAEARCREMTYVGDVFAARGHGIVKLNQELDLIVNAGPLEKMQAMLGKRIGGVFAKVTDAIAGYHVTGTIKQPDVGVELAGGRVNKVGRSMKNGINRVFDGVTDLAGAGE
jgi:hypothetical protein